PTWRRACSMPRASRCAGCSRRARPPDSAVAASVAYAPWRAPSSATASSMDAARRRRSPRGRGEKTARRISVGPGLSRPSRPRAIPWGPYLRWRPHKSKQNHHSIPGCHLHNKNKEQDMKKTGAALARFALEQLGVRFTFGIPGVHNTELYDELNASDRIQPVLVTHECGAAFMADAVSRTSESIGTLVIVPAAGVTHAASGIGEAGLDGIPMLIISGGIHSDSPYRYQLHDIDQHALLKPITKATFRIESHKDVIPTLYEAYRIATSNEPGPVFVELPYNIGNFLGDVDEMPAFQKAIATPQESTDDLREA